jgi:hypothetical protein
MAQFIKIYSDKPNEAAIAKVVKVLKMAFSYLSNRYGLWIGM